MSDTQTAEWHEARRQGIGGSDWQHVLGIEPYGCPRQCWYTKRGTPPDYSREETGAMSRGHALEDIVAKRTSEILRRRVRRPTTVSCPTLGSLPSWWRTGNPDRIIVKSDDQAGPGILECKTMGPWPYRRLKRDGPSEAWVAQVQHYLGMTGWKWGLIAALEPVSWEMSHCPINRDDELLRLMEEAGDAFWARVENGPAPDQLDASDHRCQRCEYRATCHGADLYSVAPQAAPGELVQMDDPELDELVEERIAITSVRDEANEMLKGINTRIRQHIGAPKKVATAKARVYLIESVSSRLDQKRLAAEQRHIFDAYTVQVKRRSLTVYPN